MSTGAKICLAATLTLMAAIGNIFLSTWLHLTLRQEFTDRSQLGFSNCLASLTTEPSHRMMYWMLLLVIAVGGIALVLMEKGKETYASEMTKITGNIGTPVAVGQGQHGTARWMEKKEIPETFSSVEFRGADPGYRELIQHGYDDLKKNGGNAHKNPTTLEDDSPASNAGGE